jgi:ribosome-binding factor A
MGKFNSGKYQSKGPSQRQLRVGEEIRHALSQLFIRGEIITPPSLDISSVTVSEVRISPDLRNATAYIMPLNGEQKEEILRYLQEQQGIIRTLLARKIHLKFSPRIHFKLDHSYETASHIDGLLREAKSRSVDMDELPE